MINLKGKNILVTGGSGFLADEIIRRLIECGCKSIRILARNEGRLVAVKEKYPQVQIVVGSVADQYACDRACLGMDGIIHAAAMKHVGLAEENVREAITSNLPVALLEATRKYKPEFIIGISTDKAASRKGVYGVSKFLMERLFDEYSRLNLDTKYRIVRYGNVIYSTGSVLCKWKDKLQKGESITVTDLDATRFFWTVEQAVALIFECLEKADSPSPYVCSMKSIRMGDLLMAMIDKYSIPGGPREVIVTGLQPGENLHEIIVEGAPDSSQVEKFTKEEIWRMI